MLVAFAAPEQDLPAFSLCLAGNFDRKTLAQPPMKRGEMRVPIAGTHPIPMITLLWYGNIYCRDAEDGGPDGVRSFPDGLWFVYVNLQTEAGRAVAGSGHVYDCDERRWVFARGMAAVLGDDEELPRFLEEVSKPFIRMPPIRIEPSLQEMMGRAKERADASQL